jgi:hypothetical protein
MHDKPCLIRMKMLMPSRHVLCGLLTGRDYAAAMYLDRLVHWTQHPWPWLPPGSAWLQKDCGLTDRQLAGAVSRLMAMELVEQRGSAQKVLQLRPAERTLGFLACATTWSAAYVFLHDALKGSFDLPWQMRVAAAAWKGVAELRADLIILSPEELGALAMIEEMFDHALEIYSMSQSDDKGSLHSERWALRRFLSFVAECWSSLEVPERPSSPTLPFFAEEFDAFFRAWVGSMMDQPMTLGLRMLRK